MTHKILTVDDSRTIRMIVKKAFQSYDCELFEAENGSEGLALATKEHPDLIVLDITMPVMTGIEMLGKLKAENNLKKIPVIMLTAESGKDNVMQIVKMGVKDYVVKPFKGEQLIERVKTVLELVPRFTEAEANIGTADKNYFSTKGDAVVLTLPAKITRSVGAEVDSAAKTTLEKANTAGIRKYIIDVSKVADISMTAIQLIIALVNNAVRSKMVIRLVASDQQKASLNGFKETSAMTTLPSIDAALTDF
jgi:DNA-binding response OmpR family regulator